MIEVSTREYQMSHGKAPRGRGYWAFFFDGEQDIDKAFWATPNMLFSEALKQAKAYAVAKEHTRIEVGT